MRTSARSKQGRLRIAFLRAGPAALVLSWPASICGSLEQARRCTCLTVLLAGCLDCGMKGFPGRVRRSRKSGQILVGQNYGKTLDSRTLTKAGCRRGTAEQVQCIEELFHLSGDVAGVPAFLAQHDSLVRQHTVRRLDGHQLRTGQAVAEWRLPGVCRPYWPC